MLAFFSTRTPSLDESLLRALNLAGTNPALDVFFVVVTSLGVSYVLALFAVPLWSQGRREATFDFLVLIAIVIVVTETIKFVVGRPRPCDPVSGLSGVRTLGGFGCDVETDPSFPSGHTSRAFALAAFVGVRFRWRAGAMAMSFAFLTGLSRVYLGVHWPSDVFAGALLGAGLALAFELGSRRLMSYRRIRKRIVDAIPHRRRTD